MKPANYRVTMTIGDAQEVTQTGVTVEQMNKLPVTTIPSGQFKEVTYDIALIDGVFNFSFSGSTPKINALKIERLPEQGEPISQLCIWQVTPRSPIMRRATVRRRAGARR